MQPTNEFLQLTRKINTTNVEEQESDVEVIIIRIDKAENEIDKEKAPKSPSPLPKEMPNIDRVLWLNVLFSAFLNYDLTSRYASIERCPRAAVPLKRTLFLPALVSSQPPYLLLYGVIQATLPLLFRFVFYRTTTTANKSDDLRCGVQRLTPARWVLECLLCSFLVFDTILCCEVANSLVRSCRAETLLDGFGSLTNLGFWFTAYYVNLAYGVIDRAKYQPKVRREFNKNIFALKRKYRHLRARQSQWCFVRCFYWAQTFGELELETWPSKDKDHGKTKKGVDSESLESNENQKKKKTEEDVKEVPLILNLVYPHHLYFTIWFTYDLTTRYACVGRGGDVSASSIMTNSTSPEVLITRNADAESSSSLDSILSSWILPFEVSDQPGMLTAYAIIQLLLFWMSVYTVEWILEDPKQPPRMTKLRRAIHWLVIGFLLWNVLQFCAVHGSIMKACPLDPNGAFGTWYTTALITVVYAWVFARFTRPLTELELEEEREQYQLEWEYDQALWAQIEPQWKSKQAAAEAKTKDG